MSDPPAGDHPGSYPGSYPGLRLSTSRAGAEMVNLQTFVAQLAVRVAACEARLVVLQAANDAWAAEVAAANAIAAGGMAPASSEDSDAGTIEHDLPPNAPR